MILVGSTINAADSPGRRLGSINAAAERLGCSPRTVRRMIAAGEIAGYSLGIEVASHVVRVGSAELDRDPPWDEIAALAAKEEVVLACVDPAAEARMKDEVDAALRRIPTGGHGL